MCRTPYRLTDFTLSFPLSTAGGCGTSQISRATLGDRMRSKETIRSTPSLRRLYKGAQ